MPSNGSCDTRVTMSDEISHLIGHHLDQPMACSSHLKIEVLSKYDMQCSDMQCQHNIVVHSQPPNVRLCSPLGDVLYCSCNAV